MDCSWVRIIPPEKITLSDGELLNSLNGIYGWNGSEEPFESNLIDQCEKACTVPVEEIRIADLNTLVMQGIGLKTLLQIAVPIVELTPWIDAENYGGDLVTSIVHVDDEVNNIDSNYIERMRNPVKKLLAIFRDEKRYHENHPEIWNCEYWANDIIKDLEQFLAKWSLNTD